MRASWLAPIALIADQVSKAVVMATMDRGDSVALIGNVFRLTYIHNAGAAFGLRLGSPLIHIGVSLLAMAALGWLFYTTPRENRLMRAALGLVLGGALGNIVDRVRLHEVVDFLDFGIGNLRWPVFNLADSCVTVGIGLLFLSYSWRGQSGQAEDGGPTVTDAEERAFGG